MKNDLSQLLDRGTADVTVRKNLEKKLASGKKLRVKFGIDPTGSDLHLGHAVPLFKLKQFQDAGHQVVLLFGGFTATIGDPTGKDSSRPALTLEQTKENERNYLAQAGKILDIENVELVNNRDWFEDMKPQDFIRLMAQFTVPQMMERDMFQERLKRGGTVHCHELLYPMLQGYDSVPIRADVEIGGTDQLFNLLTARPLQMAHDQAPQNVVTVPLIEGLDGVQKMSKSLGNYVGISDEANEMFGKLMSIPDVLMLKYFELLTTEDLEKMKDFIAKNPRNAKVYLAKTLVKFFHDAAAAEAAEADFVTKFVKKEIPDEMPEFKVSGEIGVLDLLSQITKFATSNSEARRLIEGGGVSLDGEKIIDPKAVLQFKGGEVLKVGKRKFAKLKV